MKSNSKQQGFVLVTALIFLMVLSVLGVMALRGSLFEERFAANDRDLALARENAELALRDAERDILGIRFDGQFCVGLCTLQRPAGTRPANAADALTFWISTNDAVNDVAFKDGGLSEPPNKQGVYTRLPVALDPSPACVKPLWSGADWNDGVARACDGSTTVAVPTVAFGTFTDAPFTAANVPRPRYMIEMFTTKDLNFSSTSTKLFFRITAVGFGRTTGAGGARTSVTLQSVFSPL
ncbi:MAG: hypothetical protein IPF55_05675 [Rhodoferax sp.]|nr:hypothetical protein [Rhodoferax sp.]